MTNKPEAELVDRISDFTKRFQNGSSRIVSFVRLIGASISMSLSSGE